VGHPFNTSIRENKGLLTCLHYSAVFLVVVASGIVPQLSSGFGLVALPITMKMQLLLGSVGTFLGCFYLEQFLRNALPPPTPPHKGYLWHKQDLQRLKLRAKEVKKLQ
jgi:manganese-transporting P-type ATPase